MQVLSMFHQLNPEFSIAGQLSVADIKAVATAGYKVIINNRPDGEEPGQPAQAEIRAAAEAAGLLYSYIPVGRSGLDGVMVATMVASLEAAGNAPVLAFCRSGARSTMLWAVAKATTGVDIEQLIAEAANAGQDISGLAGMLHGVQPLK